MAAGGCCVQFFELTWGISEYILSPPTLTKSKVTVTLRLPSFAGRPAAMHPGRYQELRTPAEYSVASQVMQSVTFPS